MPDANFDYSYYREALWLKGMHEEALAIYRKTYGRDEELLQAIEEGYADSGHDGAVLALADALAGRATSYDSFISLAGLYARVGEPDQALVWLEKAYEHRQPQILHVKAMPVPEADRGPQISSMIAMIRSTWSSS